MKAIGIVGFLILSLGVGISHSQERKTLTWSSRALYGVKGKLDDKFTVSFWRADYLGAGLELRDDDEPFKHIGWDMTPGFSYSYGELFAGIKLTIGADLYLLYRKLQGGEEFHDEYRPRFNVFLTKSLPFGGSIQFGQRLERRLWIRSQWQRFDENADSLADPYKEQYGWWEKKRYRASFRISGPGFTPAKLAPYIYIESFSMDQADLYTEIELGLSSKPVRGVSLTVADNIQDSWRVDQHIMNHMVCLYFFYTFDLSGLSFFNE